ncbi:hypothetical protein SLS56_004711 [Neofusicoccum ribis]|uniref:Major facilitator superfamily (MFS) profile domain-containing protein n=1 Tax=Neofusicoccum ribis TaxID=45134 RepID=A0ABR3SWG6_9PEZI
MADPKTFTDDPKLEIAETRSDASDIDYEAEKKLLWKMDWIILPTIAPLYVFSFLDRVNIGNARLYGLEEDLGLSSMQFSIAISLFFVTYVCVEIPSNLVIKRIGPSRWIAFITFVWGIVATLTGLVQNFGGLVACRLVLGIFEGGFVPGIIVYLTLFYTKKEMALRIAFFMVSAPTAGAFGGLLAYGIGHMDGILGHRGWRWIFILEGIPTCILAIIVFFIMADGPETAKFLSPDEKALLRLRQKRCTGWTESSEVLHKEDVYRALLDWKLWMFCVSGFGSATTLYGYATFLPTIIHGIDPSYSTAMVQVMTIPCYCAGGIVSLFVAYASDRLQFRGGIAAGMGLISCTGYVILLSTDDSSAGYAGCFLIPLGIYTMSGLSLTWLTTNNPRYGKRVTAVAMGTMSVNCGGIMMSYIYPKDEGPRYHRGHAITLSLTLVSISTIAFLSWYFARANRRRAAGKEDYKIAGMTDEQIKELGDRSPRFVYTA